MDIISTNYVAWQFRVSPFQNNPHLSYKKKGKERTKYIGAIGNLIFNLTTNCSMYRMANL